MGDDDFEILQTAIEDIRRQLTKRMSLPEFIHALNGGRMDNEAAERNIIIGIVGGQMIVILPECLRRGPFKFLGNGNA